MIEIDGSVGEGGGQVLRTALSVACVLEKPVRVFNIRAGRSPPGLKAQHLAVCNLLASIANGKVKGAELGSEEITFEPGEIKGGEHFFDIGTAGSCTLLLQAALPVLLHAKKESALTITGGTHVRAAPTFDYFAEVFLPAVRKFGVRAEARMLAAGFYPKGGGKVGIRVAPSGLLGAVLLPGGNEPVRYSIISSGLPSHVAKREEEKLKETLAGKNFDGKISEAKALSPGNAVTLWSGFFGASSLGEIGKPSEKVAEEACGALLSEMGAGASVDSHLADQLLLYACLAKGKSEYSAGKFSSHLSTNAAVLSAMTGRNIILGEKGKIEVV